MICKNCTINNKLGIHARPAAKFVKVANNFTSSVKIKKEQDVVDGKSILGLMMLALGEGSTIELMITGEDQEKAMLELSTIIESNFED